VIRGDACRRLTLLQWELLIAPTTSQSRLVIDVWKSPNSITPTLRLSPKLPPGESSDTNHVADFYDLCPRLSKRGNFGKSRRNEIWAKLHDDRRFWTKDWTSASIYLARWNHSLVADVLVLVKWYIALHTKPIWKLRSVTCHMRLHCVICHPPQVNETRHNPSKTSQYSICLPRRDKRPSWPWCWLYTGMVNLSADSHPSK